VHLQLSSLCCYHTTQTCIANRIDFIIMTGRSHAMLPTLVVIPNNFDMMDSVIGDFNYDFMGQTKMISCV
jgi:hypothetical protein